jgi:polyhydroxyalkanoate synthase subunit PhaC
MSSQRALQLEPDSDSLHAAPAVAVNAPAPAALSPQPTNPPLGAETARELQSKGLAPGNAPSTGSEAPPAQASAPEGIGKAGATPTPDFERIVVNFARLMEQGGRALAALICTPQTGAQTDVSESLADAYRSLSQITAHWLGDPARALEAQTSLAAKFLGLWASSLRRLSGEQDKPVVPLDPSDKRFAAPEWREVPYFDFLRQAHAIISQWADDLIQRSSDVDPKVREKARFYLRQISSALSPSNFLATNPELIKETWETSGENLARGAELLAKDIESGKGTLKISQTDTSKFLLGVNIAVSPGKVIFRNDLIELIQYAPATEEVYKRPLLIVPPWINKFYILDLNPEKSFVRFAVENRLTVFMISWVNPDRRHRRKGFEAYMREGVFAALDAINEATGESKVAAIGYCIGGTLLAMTLAYMAQTGDKRITSATFFAAQTDFSQAGDLRVFVDENRLRALKVKLAETGYLDASAMASAFNMLRPEDLIWSYVVNNYMKGKPPHPFDLLAWNADSTRMTEACHLAYLRDCYLENKLAKGKARLGGKTLKLANISVPVYDMATREDHIAPAKSVFIGAKLFGGNVRFVLAGSGHIAGVINPVRKPKYQYWAGPAPEGEFADWCASATEHKGSWWPDWLKWITRQSLKKVPARRPGDGALAPVCDAPGEYVRVRY